MSKEQPIYTEKVGIYSDIPHPVVQDDSAVNDIITSLMILNYKLPKKVYQRNKDNEIMRDAQGNAIIRDIRGDIERAYQEFTGKTFTPDLMMARPRPMCLIGPPGQGKTESFKQAAKTFCNLMDYEYLFLPDEHTPINDNSFVLASLELAGETSNLAVAGIPASVEYKETLDDGRVIVRKQMDRVPNASFVQLQRCAAGIYLFDDITSADKAIMNTLLSVIDEGDIQGNRLPMNVFRGATGNLGKQDNTASEQMSSALKTRFKTLFMYLNRSSFMEIMENKYPSTSPAVSMLMSFLESNQSFYNTTPKQNSYESFASPRSLENLLTQLCEIDACNANNSDNELYRKEVYRYSHALCGSDFAQNFATHCYMHRSHAIPIARELIQNGKLSPKYQAIFDQNYGDGISNKKSDFAMQISYALVDEFITETIRRATFEKDEDGNMKSYINISKDKNDIEDLVTNLMTGFSKLKRGTKNLEVGMNRLRIKLPMELGRSSATRKKGMSANTKEKDIIYSLTSQAVLAISEVMYKHDYVDKNNLVYDILQKSISGISAMQGSMMSSTEQAATKRRFKKKESSPSP